MQNQNRLKQIDVVAVSTEKRHREPVLHPAWTAFIRYCAALRHGEIETLKIQDGLPVIAEVVRKKIKFTT